MTGKLNKDEFVLSAKMLAGWLTREQLAKLNEPK